MISYDLLQNASIILGAFNVYIYSTKDKGFILFLIRFLVYLFKCFDYNEGGKGPSTHHFCLVLDSFSHFVLMLK